MIMPKPIKYNFRKPPIPFPEMKWNLGTEYQIVGDLGQGSYGKVYEAVDTNTGRKVAIKKFLRALCHPHLAHYCLRELEILAKISHPNIVKKYRILHSNSSVYIAMEHMPLDFKKLLRSPTFLDHSQIRALMYETLLALNYLHSAKIVHRDIKPGNILASLDCKVKICDFGLARSVCGLKITEYDFDQIYRIEFADSNEQTLVSGIAGKSGTEDLDSPDEFEDVEENVHAKTGHALPGYFIASREEKKHKEKDLSLDQSTVKSSSLANSTLSPTPSSESPSTDKKVPDVEAKCPFSRLKQRRMEFMKEVKEDPTIERELTTHIASRWYRAPEVVLLEKVYSSAVDMWGLGCVFGELLQMIKKNKEHPISRKPMFPGTSCFPLSPMLKPGIGKECEHFNEGDQLVTICKVLGSPSEEEIGFITDAGAKEYVKMLPPAERVSWETLFPACNSEELDLLDKLLQFNPFMRITTKEALRHPYFKPIRKKPREIEVEPIKLEAQAADSDSIRVLNQFCEQDYLHS